MIGELKFASIVKKCEIEIYVFSQWRRKSNRMTAMSVRAIQHGERIHSMAAFEYVSSFRIGPQVADNYEDGFAVRTELQESVAFLVNCVGIIFVLHPSLLLFLLLLLSAVSFI